MFLPLTFGYEKADGTIVDLMEETFGIEAVKFAATKVEASSSMMMIIIIVIVVLVVLIVALFVVKKHMAKVANLNTVHKAEELVEVDSAREDPNVPVSAAPGTAGPEEEAADMEKHC